MNWNLVLVFSGICQPSFGLVDEVMDSLSVIDSDPGLALGQIGKLVAKV